METEHRQDEQQPETVTEPDPLDGIERRNCEECQAEFTVPNKRAARQKYCRERCRLRAMERRRRERPRVERPESVALREMITAPRETPLPATEHGSLPVSPKLAEMLSSTMRIPAEIRDDVLHVARLIDSIETRLTALDRAG